jgi:hypothetical protein
MDLSDLDVDYTKSRIIVQRQNAGDEKETEALRFFRGIPCYVG